MDTVRIAWLELRLTGPTEGARTRRQLGVESPPWVGLLPPSPHGLYHTLEHMLDGEACLSPQGSLRKLIPATISGVLRKTVLFIP